MKKGVDIIAFIVKATEMFCQFSTCSITMVNNSCCPLLSTIKMVRLILYTGHMIGQYSYWKGHFLLFTDTYRDLVLNTWK